MWPCWGRSQPLLVSPRSDLSRGSRKGALGVAANRCTSRCPPAQPRNSVFLSDSWRKIINVLAAAALVL